MTAKIGSCCLCGGRYELWGNNPHPLAKKGRCCRDCNQIVVQARIARAVEQRLVKLARPAKATAAMNFERPTLPPAFMPRADGCWHFGVSKTRMYELAKIDGDILIRLGGRTLVDVERLKALIASMPRGPRKT